MVSIPIELFLSTIALSLALAVIALWQKIPIVMIMSGTFITFLAVITDILIMGKIPESSTTVLSTTTYTFIDNEFIFTQWHQILIMLIGSITMISGGILQYGKQ